MTETILEIKEVSHEQINGQYSSYGGFTVKTDKQEIRLLICEKQYCCESFGYFMCNDNVQDFVGARVGGISITDSALNTRVFNENCYDYESTGCMIFVNIETDRGVLQFVAYNVHNGYYGHDAHVISKQLIHSETL